MKIINNFLEVENVLFKIAGAQLHFKYIHNIILYTMFESNMSLLFLNKRPMGHIAHLRKQFKSINTYDYIITLIKRRKKTLLTS